MRTVRSFANEEGEAMRYSDCLGITYKLYKKLAVLYAGFVWVTQVRCSADEFIVRMWSVRCTRLKNTQKVKISPGTEFFGNSQKLHFRGNVCRLWKPFWASARDQSMIHFGSWPTRPFLSECLVHYATGTLHPFSTFLVLMQKLAHFYEKFIPENVIKDLH